MFKMFITEILCTVTGLALHCLDVGIQKGTFFPDRKVCRLFLDTVIVLDLLNLIKLQHFTTIVREHYEI